MWDRPPSTPGSSFSGVASTPSRHYSLALNVALLSMPAFIRPLPLHPGHGILYLLVLCRDPVLLTYLF